MSEKPKDADDLERVAQAAGAMIERGKSLAAQKAGDCYVGNVRSLKGRNIADLLASPDASAAIERLEFLLARPAAKSVLQ